jgi:hypothetical protein
LWYFNLSSYTEFSLSFIDEIEDSMQATPRVRRSSQVAKAQDTSKDVANCFGFDDDEDDEEDDEEDDK